MSKITYHTPLDNIEEKAMVQIKELEARENVENICVFPDIHYCAEKMIPVGLAFSTKDVIYPLITGKDMGCGVAYYRIPKTDVLKPFDKNKHYRAFEKAHREMTDEGLGGGNHFISLEEDEHALYIIVHTGTRNRGIYMFQKNLSLLREFGNENYFTVEFLEENHPDWFVEYEEVIQYGVKRRKEFLDGTMNFLDRNGYLDFGGANTYGDSVHNHIKKENGLWVHRKGATELNNAVRNNVVVVPLSMTRGSLFVESAYYVGDSNFLNSCSHGAGRKLSRTDTLKHWHSLKKKKIKEYEEKFGELLDRSGKFGNGLIQEFDFAYKDSNNLMKEQKFLRKVYETTPICTIKFSEI